MAAAYAALVSLTHIIEQTMEIHARQPIFSHEQQRQIESFQPKVSFLINLFEVFYSNGGSSSSSNNNQAQEGLESRIAHAAYAAQDTILSQVPKKQVKKSTIMFDALPSCFSLINGKNRSNQFSQGLPKVIENIDDIMKEAMEIKEKKKIEDPVPIVSSRPPTIGKNITMEYYDDDLEQIMDKLTGEPSNLQIIPIIGMGGIGKTTLARYVYYKPLIVERFDIRAWVTISQEYNLRELLLVLLDESGIPSNKTAQESSEYHQLGVKLHKHLSGRKYLIIIDDVWSIDVWEKLKLFLPDYDNGSRVMITSRLSNVANGIASSHLYKMNLLDENKSWSLLCKKVFGRDGNCPSELEKIGKDIAKNCKGLPLSIVVIGGLLAKSDMTRRYWEYIAKDINQIVNSENSGHWLKILSLSYNHLPIHLKPCFLYLGVYPEDSEICVSELIKLWVAEGFLKTNITKSLEEVAEDYLNDLVERNLVYVRKWGSIGKLKSCSIHDLLRDLCLREARNEMFRCVLMVRNHSHYVKNERSIVLSERGFHQFDPALQSTTNVRTLLCNFDSSLSWKLTFLIRILLCLGVLTPMHTYSVKRVLRLVNLQYLECNALWGFTKKISQVFQLRYLQTLILKSWMRMVAPNEIWEMPQLRHLISRGGISLPDPLRGRLDNGQDDCVLKNLQTLKHITNFNCTEDVVKRIPNVKKLSIEMETSNDYNCLHNLYRLHKLQSLCCCFYGDRGRLFHNVVFPQSLKKLTLRNCCFDWDDITEKVGSLPHLEKLRLCGVYGGAEWNTVEGKFLCLKFLEISHCDDLVCWTAAADSTTHFPTLQRLLLKNMTKLEEIPSGIVGDTLQSIELVSCGISVVNSARAILEEQQNNGNEGLLLTIRKWNSDKHAFEDV